MRFLTLLIHSQYKVCAILLGNVDFYLVCYVLCVLGRFVIRIYRVLPCYM
jgi:hypothetical protein